MLNMMRSKNKTAHSTSSKKGVNIDDETRNILKFKFSFDIDNYLMMTIQKKMQINKIKGLK